MERKSRRDKIPGKKLHIFKCHLGLSTVVDHEHCPPIGDSHYYQGFEFYPIGEMGIEPSKDSFEKYFRQYLTPYFESEDIFEDELSEDFVADPLLSKKCSDCRSTSDCDEAVKSSFSRKLVLGIHVEKQAFCPKQKYLPSSEDECQVCRKLFDGKPRLPKKKIRIHDLRFMGHPVEVNIHYLYARCSRKVAGMKALPGIHEGSNSNPIRFSCRLAKAINTALAENLRQTYIAEACAIPISTINHWEKREHAIHADTHEVKTLSSSFMCATLPHVSSTELSIHRKKYVFVFHQTDGVDTLHAIYTGREWEAMRNLVSGKCWEFLNMEDVRLLNLACDYLSCCTDVPPYLGAMLLADLYHWAETGYVGQISCLINVLRCQTMGNCKELADRYQKWWDKYYDLFRELRVMDKALCLALFKVLFSTNKDAEEYNLASWYRNTIPKESLLRSPAMRSGVPEIFNEISRFIVSSPLPHQEIIARLLYFNPIVLPHEKSSWLSPYAFTENGDFDYSKGSTVQPPLDKLLQLLEVGLLSEGGTVPMTQLLQNPETPTDLN